MSSEHDGKDQDDLFSPLPYLLVSGAVVLMTLLLRCLFCPRAVLIARTGTTQRPRLRKSITRRFIGAAHSSGSQWPQPGRTWPSTSSA